MASNNPSLLKTIYVTNIEDEKEIIGILGKIFKDKKNSRKK